ncbi:MAG: imidazole glycerol phosphate synthase subunit HisH [Proteobacteria bacterium]|nr:imidazole glycerol phosphate synthase subunit HisH [Pseudomonadota bacterium]
MANGPSLVIVDYGMGNLRSAQKGFEAAGIDAIVSGDPADVENADGVVLPGVGAFRDCMSNLSQARLIDPLQSAIREGRPFLGICLGMQLLLSLSEEFGLHQGLDVIRGRVVRFPSARNLKVPHMGWNRVHQASPTPLLEGVPDGAYFYFVHSYFAVPEDPGVVAGWTEYGTRFASVISTGNVFATQFHPEKSDKWGIRVLGNFGKIVSGAREV